jgi:hypothetical protein
MKHERLMGLVGTAITRGAPLLMLLLCVSAAVAYTVHWHQTRPAHGARAPFSLLASPGSLSVSGGGTARFLITIHRGRYRGKIRLTAVNAGLLARSRPPGERNRASLQVRGQRAVLTVHTVAADRPGRYSVKVRGVGGRYQGYLTLGLTITSPVGAPFAISGTFGPLWPGVSQSLDLALTNPNSQAIAINSLVVALKYVNAPRASSSLPCSLADFSVVPFAGPYPLRVPAHATVRLSDLGVRATRAPRVEMLDRPVNQDGCRGATVTLAYSGSATSP